MFKRSRNQRKKAVKIGCCTLIYSLSSMFFASSTEFFAPQQFQTTYEKFLSKAVAGDTDAQNFIGYMNFYGEGAKLDYDQAHYWFRLAAESGHIKAQHNLGLFYARVLARIPERYFDPQKSNYWLAKAGSSSPLAKLPATTTNESIDYVVDGEPPEVGKGVYQRFCAGCHGYNGIATYSVAPSFAKGERLTSTDKVLLESIARGKNIMPPWEQVLSDELRIKVLAYIGANFGTKVIDESPTITTLPERENDSKMDVQRLGSNTYAKYCAGCHGFSGIAYYVNSPSFALGERMDKGDGELKTSIRNGRNIMPGWSDLLTGQQIDALVTYIRSLSRDFDLGIEREINSPSSFYYTFTPKDGS